ncbi:MAG: DUF2779 domain-containing protein [Coriobacteriia bacterium]|nr:DUF2779 domain-containing protein [Coriobacteriia bacterium]
MATQDDEPDIDIGAQCGSPYACGYTGYCWRHVPENSVFDIAKLLTSKKFAAYQNGVITFEDALTAGLKFTDKQLTQVLTEVNGLSPQIDTQAVQEFLGQIRYPLYLLDFETFQQAIPQWDGVRPWMQIPFQYSLHIQASKGTEPEYREFLAQEGENPLLEVARQLRVDIPADVCVMAYNMFFEQKCLRDLVRIVPEYAAHLMSIHDNMVDLMAPFAEGSYYARGFKGFYSIKVVLPTLCPGDPELDYHGLDIVHNGGEAMTIYQNLHQQTPERRAEVRKALLAYCRLDTLAMVKILEKLYEAVERG